jgi:hypothetical protein
MNPILPLVAALALSGAAQPSDQDADTAAYDGHRDGVTYYDFDDDSIEGEVLSPEGAVIHSRTRLRHASLLNIRPHFIEELTWLALDAP